MTARDEDTTRAQPQPDTADDYRQLIEANAAALTSTATPEVVRATAQSVSYYGHRLADALEHDGAGPDQAAAAGAAGPDGAAPTPRADRG